MFLHEDKDAFLDVISQTRNEQNLASSIIEKDYYVTMLLKELSMTNIDFVFKGGTSLSKCYHAIDRFSEDIDLTILSKPTQSQRAQIKETILAAGKRLSLEIANADAIRSRCDFNRYIFLYPTVAEDSMVSNRIIVELFVAIAPFPIENRIVDSLVLETMEKHHLMDEIQNYQLGKFLMPVQSIKRTLIDKIFAVCDYYMKQTPERNSRHIYDIYQILKQIPPHGITRELVSAVREVRRANPVCVSAQDEVNIPDVLNEIIKSNYFIKDYEELTLELLHKPISYQTAIQSLNIIASWDVFL